MTASAYGAVFHGGAPLGWKKLDGFGRRVRETG